MLLFSPSGAEFKVTLYYFVVLENNEFHALHLYLFPSSGFWLCTTKC